MGRIVEGWAANFRDRRISSRRLSLEWISRRSSSSSRRCCRSRRPERSRQININFSNNRFPFLTTTTNPLPPPSLIVNNIRRATSTPPALDRIPNLGRILNIRLPNPSISTAPSVPLPSRNSRSQEDSTPMFQANPTEIHPNRLPTSPPLSPRRTRRPRIKSSPPVRMLDNRSRSSNSSNSNKRNHNRISNRRSRTEDTLPPLRPPQDPLRIHGSIKLVIRRDRSRRITQTDHLDIRIRKCRVICKRRWRWRCLSELLGRRVRMGRERRRRGRIWVR